MLRKGKQIALLARLGQAERCGHEGGPSNDQAKDSYCLPGAQHHVRLGRGVGGHAGGVGSWIYTLNMRADLYSN